MLVLGISGGFDQIDAAKIKIGHDSAAVLLRNGNVVAAFEEERLNRIKHTNKFAANAIRACLDAAGVRFGDVDRIAFNISDETALGVAVLQLMQGVPLSTLFELDRKVDMDPRAFLHAILEREFGSVDARRIRFVKHHLTHALSAFSPSGFDQALVVTMDGEGDSEAGCVATADASGIRVKAVTSVANSLGILYLNLTHFLGFKFHDEFKVMGLAPYGDPAVYRNLFKRAYSLRPNGAYEIHNEQLLALARQVEPRHRSQPIEQRHKDVAASLQETLETIVFHVLRHHQSVTKMQNLCLAGGVAHNCTLNGKILRSGLFSNVYVQPASHDAGCALGAALWASSEGAPGPSTSRARVLPHLYLGSDIGDAEQVRGTLQRWGSLLSVRSSESVANDAAALLAQGRVIGWVQGRAEFGPRALGNRSILADPRPPENKEIINAMVKKREGFRPFAPVVPVERARDYFEIPAAGADLGHMTYVLNVREDQRATLGAVTHVDGTARVQTVTRDSNRRFWEVIEAFGRLTGVSVLLNTSFNNNAEPIVDSIDDAVVCFLTTKLNALVVGDFVVEKAELSHEQCQALVPSLCKYTRLERVKRLDAQGKLSEIAQLANTYDSRTIAVSVELWRLLDAADGQRSLGQLVAALDLNAERVFQELVELWAIRVITLMPL